FFRGRAGTDPGAGSGMLIGVGDGAIGAGFSIQPPESSHELSELRNIAIVCSCRESGGCRRALLYFASLTRFCKVSTHRMRALCLTAPGGLNALRVVDLPPPAAPGPGEVRVGIRAAALNHLDLSIANGLPGLPTLTYPHTVGTDGAGT